jgi:hypothetical protein
MRVQIRIEDWEFTKRISGEVNELQEMLALLSEGLRDAGFECEGLACELEDGTVVWDID